MLSISLYKKNIIIFKIKNYLNKFIFYLIFLFILLSNVANIYTLKPSYANDCETIIDIKDQIGDDKGPGYYQYPLDKRIRRGTFDIKRFTVTKKNSTYIFTIQMREYIMTHWPQSFKGNDQGFVVNMFDIYIDLDGLPYKGYNEALPSREVIFAENKGWEKVILITPLSYYKAYEMLKSKTDDLDFQEKINDIILPDYIDVQRDKIIVRISQNLIGDITNKSGFQCFSMGFSEILSPNRLFNMDVRAFATLSDFGGGYDTYGDPPIIDLILPANYDQYSLLRAYRSNPSRYDIVKVQIPFIYVANADNNPSSTSVYINQPNSHDSYKTIYPSQTTFKHLPNLPLHIPQSQSSQFSTTKSSYSFDIATTNKPVNILIEESAPPNNYEKANNQQNNSQSQNFISHTKSSSNSNIINSNKNISQVTQNTSNTINNWNKLNKPTIDRHSMYMQSNTKIIPTSNNASTATIISSKTSSDTFTQTKPKYLKNLTQKSKTNSYDSNNEQNTLDLEDETIIEAGFIKLKDIKNK